MVRATKTISSKCGAVTLVLSLLFLFVALLCAFFRQPLKTIVDGLIQYQTSISPDSMMTGLWMNPPLTPKVQKMQEIGLHQKFNNFNNFNFPHFFLR